eukprot:COSAG05_NODE_965_length_6403_cov_50.682741_2_plen_146_part_00
MTQGQRRPCLLDYRRGCQKLPTFGPWRQERLRTRRRYVHQSVSVLNLCFFACLRSCFAGCLRLSTLKHARLIFPYVLLRAWRINCTRTCNHLLSGLLAAPFSRWRVIDTDGSLYARIIYNISIYILYIEYILGLPPRMIDRRKQL